MRVKKFTKWLQERDRVFYESLDEAFKASIGGQFTQTPAYRGIDETKFHEVQMHGLIPSWDFKRDPLGDFDMDDLGAEYGYDDPYDHMDEPDIDPSLAYADMGIDPNEKYTFIADDEDEARTYGSMLLKFPMPADAVQMSATNEHYFATATLVPPNLIEIQDDRSMQFVPIQETELRNNMIVYKGAG